MNGSKPLEGPVSVQLYFRMPRPKSAPKSRKLPCVRPDLDHLVRAVGDALSGVVYKDDGQITSFSLEKSYSDEPGVAVWASEVR